jgi:hypothetical protein
VCFRRLFLGGLPLSFSALYAERLSNGKTLRDKAVFLSNDKLRTYMTESRPFDQAEKDYDLMGAELVGTKFGELCKVAKQSRIFTYLETVEMIGTYRNEVNRFYT